MCHMKVVPISDLRYHFPKLEKLLLSGEEIQITKRGKVIARLVAEPGVDPGSAPLPDFMAGLKEIYGDQICAVTGAEIVSADREGR